MAGLRKENQRLECCTAANQQPLSTSSYGSLMSGGQKQVSPLISKIRRKGGSRGFNDTSSPWIGIPVLARTETILRLADPRALTELRLHPELIHLLGEVLGPTTILIPAKHVPSVRKILLELGYIEQ